MIICITLIIKATKQITVIVVKVQWDYGTYCFQITKAMLGWASSIHYISKTNYHFLNYIEDDHSSSWNEEYLRSNVKL